MTGNLGELLGAVQALQVAGTETDAVSHFDRLGDARRRSLVKEGVFEALLGSVYDTIVSFTTGVILIAAAHQMRAGDFTVGDFALFVTYIRSGALSWLPVWLGSMVADLKRSGVSLGRIGELLPEQASDGLVEPGPLYLKGELPEVPFVPKDRGHRLAELEASELTYIHPSSGRGIHNVDLRLTRGSITVVTGRVGAGKTTLLETVLGAIPKDSGEVYWNGEVVEDPANFLVPPRCAYTSQVPRLFSETLRDNILMGLPEHRVDLAGAIGSAVLEQDIEALENGLDTVVGPRASGCRAARSSAQPPRGRSCATPSCWSSTTFPAHSTSKRSRNCGTGCRESGIPPVWPSRTGESPCGAPTISSFSKTAGSTRKGNSKRCLNPNPPKG